MNLSLRCRRTTVTKSATILGPYILAAVIAAIVPFLRLTGSLPIVVVVAALVIAFLVGQQLVRYNSWVRLGGLLSAALFVVLTGLAVHSTVLALHGDRRTGTVTNVVVDGSYGYSRSFDYVLAGSDGQRIPGQLSERTRKFDVGDAVAVVVDRNDWVGPETTGEVDSVGPFWLAAGIGLALTVVMSVLGGRSRETGRPPRPARGESGSSPTGDRAKRSAP